MRVLKLAMILADERETLGQPDLPVPYFGAAPAALLEGLAQCRDVELHLVTCVRQPLRLPECLAGNIFYHGSRVPAWGFLRTAYVPCILKTRRVLRQLRPDIVHGQGTERYYALAASLSGRPNLVTLHGHMADIARVTKARPGSFYWNTAQLEKIALKRTWGVFCNSRATQALIAPRARRTWLVPNAVRGVFFSDAPAPGHQPQCVLLHVGAVCENKQQLEMLRMARSLWRQKSDFELHFIGAVNPATRYGDAFLNEARQAEAEGFARYVSPKSAEDLVCAFDRASALVHTPIVETFGLVVAEALARNLKLFGFRVGGMTDIAENVPSAVLVDPNDWAALGGAIISWLRAGRPNGPPTSDLMRDRYHPLVIARRHVEIYREVLNRPE